MRWRPAAPSWRGPAGLPVPALLAGGAFCAWLVSGGAFLADDFVQLANFGHWDAAGTLWDRVLARFGASVDGVNGFWRPLAYLTYALNYVANGADARAWIAVNLAVHLSSAVLVAALVRRLGADDSAAARPGGEGGAAATLAPVFAGIFFFAWSPGWEATLWIACRYDSFATFFTLLAAWAYAGRRRALALVAVALALASKESGSVAFVLVGMLALARAAGPAGVSLRARGTQVARDLWPFVTLGLAYIALRIALFGSATRVYMGMEVDLLALDHWRRLASSGVQWGHANFPGAPGARLAAFAATAYLLATCLALATRSRATASALGAVLATLAIALAMLLPHLPMFDPSGLGGRLFYQPAALLALALGLSVHALRHARRGLAVVAGGVAAALLAAHLYWGWRATEEYRDVHAQMRAVIAAVGSEARTPHAPVAVLFVPDRVGRVAFGRNAQAGLMLPPVQPAAVSGRVLVQLDTEIPALPAKIAAGLIDALPREGLFALMQRDGVYPGMAPIAPSSYRCWSAGPGHFVPMVPEAAEGALAQRLAKAYVRAGCGGTESLK